MPLRIVGAAVAAVALVLGAAACGGGGGGERAASKEDIAAGAKLYADNCANCHGPEGTGGSGPVLKEKRFLENATEERLRNQIAVGIPKTQMPAWSKENGGPMDDAQIRQIAAYLKSLEPTAPVVENRRQPRTP